MLQTEYSDRERIDADAIEYLDELVAVGELPQKAKVNRCGDCADKGLVRTSIFGEDCCRRCWRGEWDQEV